MGAYQRLASMSRSGLLDLSRARFFQLDAYLGERADSDGPNLYAWILRDLIEPAGIPLRNVHRLSADASDPAKAGRDLDRLIGEVGGVDLAILGLGLNGHVGFNEPGTSSSAGTRVVDLSHETLASNAEYWSQEHEVPRQGITVGLGTLVESRQILLLVSGAHKSAILKRALEGPITDEVPASHLRSAADLIVIADYAAASDLTR
jgi:glucosamine-6-phosphate deaminase